MRFYLVHALSRFEIHCGKTMPAYDAAGHRWVSDEAFVVGDPGEYLVVSRPDEEAGNMTPTPMQFLLMLTGPEQVAIRKAAETDPYVQMLVQMVDDTRLTFVELSNPTVIDAIKYLTTTDPVLLTKERAARLLKGLGPIGASESAS